MTYPSPTLTSRRRALGVAIAGGGALIAGPALLAPTRAWAADPMDAAFEARTLADVYAALKIKPTQTSSGLTLEAPDVAENGALVPVSFSARLPGLQYVALIGEKNPFPLIAVVGFERGDEGTGSLRIKVGDTSTIRVVAQTSGGAFTAAKEVRITVGGCAGT